MPRLFNNAAVIVLIFVCAVACESEDVKPIQKNDTQLSEFNGSQFFADDTGGGGEDEEDPIIQD
ncbi:hypothetical protein LVD15_17680 [Fulvivirga maritima]|uniref:hypothetical protein n=1 Tax=Fulvivirga maritima TaxID=2904247 RepID=UPI001F1BC7DC|nr:hypothetical protein [Fulvivirga maritima]UII25127.1 hypothetical protein LVD15_17680 [Fulvivirga maritima]